MIEISDIKFDCRYFKGDIPCKPNKEYNVICNDCNYYKKYDTKILIIKLGAAGDVIRTTPLIYPLKSEYPDSKIYWLTHSPEVVPVNPGIAVDEVLDFSLQNIIYLQETGFDVVINLDKDKEAIGLMNMMNSKKKFGYALKDGVCFPSNKLAEHKFLTGVFDNVSKSNKKSYLEEIFEMCGYEFKGERYILEPDVNYDVNVKINSLKKIIGLNTGCGSRWTSRNWKDDFWLELIKRLTDYGFEVILLGGPQEDEKNKLFSESTKAKYFGYFPIKSFFNLVNKCDLIVTQVTMAMHIAIGLNKKLVLMNNIFNPNEFELYGNGEIIQPRKECKCFFKPECKNKEYQCMEHLFPKDVFDSVINQIGEKK
jgi:ADP-heptose:LPS heptosyltransferase